MASWHTGEVADLERLAASTSDGITRTITRLGKLAAAVIVCTAALGAATFATGWWVFDGSAAWIVLGGFVCLVPVTAAAFAWLLVFRTVRLAPRLLGDVRAYLSTRGTASNVLIDHDSGVPLGAQAQSFSAVQADLSTRRRDFPALYAGVRAITRVPVLAAVAVLTLLGVGALGTLLMIGGLID
jgi:hypothetical protein